MSSKLLLRAVGSEVLHRLRIHSLLARFGQPWRILMYHRVTSPEELGYPLQAGMYVRPEHFGTQMSWLKQNATVLDIDSLVSKVLRREKIAPGTVAISFDDGWEDNYRNAFPILKSLELPATIFLATDYIDSHGSFWSDVLPFALSRLRAKGCDRIRLANLAQVHELADASLQQVLFCTTCDQTYFEQALERLINHLKSVPRETREGFTDALLAQVAEGKPRSFLSWDEVREMSRHGISFGSHTHRHIPLDELEAEEIRRELSESRQQLRANEAAVTGTFCYPEGRYSQRSQQVLKDEGILASLAVSAASRLDTIPALLGRIGMHDDISSTVAMFSSRLWLQR